MCSLRVWLVGCLCVCLTCDVCPLLMCVLPFVVVGCVLACMREFVCLFALLCVRLCVCVFAWRLLFVPG